MKILNKLFDKIYLITMKGSSRTEGALEKLKDVDFEIFWGINGGELDQSFYQERGSKLTKGQMGCSKSHVELYKLIYQSKFKNALILEDDFVITENFHLLESSFNQLPEDYGFFYLGHYNCFTNNLFSPNLTQISQENFVHLHGTHAISIQPSFAKKLKELNENLHFTADGLISHIVKDQGSKVFAAIPSLINQDLSLIKDSVNIDLNYK